MARGEHMTPATTTRKDFLSVLDFDATDLERTVAADLTDVMKFRVTSSAG